MSLFESKLYFIAGTNKDYYYQKITETRDRGKYILYVKGTPSIIRAKARDIKEYARAHYTKRKSCNFNEPKYEINYFNPYA